MNDNTEFLYFNSKGKPCGKDEAVLCVIREKDSSGKVIRETEVPIYDDDKD